jgi:hypothetical protein
MQKGYRFDREQSETRMKELARAMELLGGRSNDLLDHKSALVDASSKRKLIRLLHCWVIPAHGHFAIKAPGD